MRRLGHITHSSRAAGRHQGPDEAQLLFAASQNLILVTRNGKDLSLLHNAWLLWPAAWGFHPQPAHPGIIVIPHQPTRPFPDIAVAIDQLVGRLPGRALQNSLHFLDTFSMRWVANWRPTR